MSYRIPCTYFIFLPRLFTVSCLFLSGVNEPPTNSFYRSTSFVVKSILILLFIVKLYLRVHTFPVNGGGVDTSFVGYVSVPRPFSSSLEVLDLSLVKTDLIYSLGVPYSGLSSGIDGNRGINRRTPRGWIRSIFTNEGIPFGSSCLAPSLLCPLRFTKTRLPFFLLLEKTSDYVSEVPIQFVTNVNRLSTSLHCLLYPLCSIYLLTLRKFDWSKPPVYP